MVSKNTRNWDKVHALLMNSDSPLKYYPANFDFKGEDERVSALCARIEQRMPLRALGEDYSLNQDGARFVKVLLLDKMALSVVGEIHISSFGRLATVQGVLPPYVSLVESVLNESGYIYLDREALERPYDGSYSDFVGESWYSRYFAPWYKFNS